MDAKTLEHKLQSAGYQHPTGNNLDRGSKYKTFSDGETRKAKDINDFKGTVVGRNYSLSKNIEDLDYCPKCKSEVVHSCQCGYSDKTCKNGHTWYIDRDGSTKLGNPHNS